MTTQPEQQIIGRAEQLDFPELGLRAVPARIDTGARTSAMWASDARVEDGVLWVVFFAKGNPHHTGVPVQFKEFEEVMVASSTGHTQRRYLVKLQVRLKGRKIRASFTLADRSTQVYPVLVGRNVLRGKFVVDVKQGKALRAAEKQRIEDLEKLLGNTQPKEDIS
jgi:hypothetical protein